MADGTMYAHQLDYWTPEHPNASLPRISAVHNNVNNTQASSFWMKDVSYLRLKTVELYYELPSAVLKNMFLDNLRRSEEHTSELQSLMRISYAVFCLKKNKNIT